MATSKRYFSVSLGRTDEVAPENGETLINEEPGGGAANESVSFAENSSFAANGSASWSSKDKNRLRRHFRHKRNKGNYATNNDDDEDDPYAGPAPVDKEKLNKYLRGKDLRLRGIRTGFYKQKFAKQRRRYEACAQQAARAELLLPEDAGFIEPDENEATYRLTQKEIVDSVNILTATKHFELDLRNYGPYRCNYTNNGRHLLLGGRKAHVAAVDWLTKDLLCEINVMETVRDVRWLHNETIFAVAQKHWTYLYDRRGTELHCLKNLYQTRRLEFLPYHFLLVAATSVSFVHWLDVSMGKLVRSTNTKQGPLDVMCINPATAVTHLGTTRGTVTLWSPNAKEPLAKMLCHGSPVRGLTVDSTGTYMATSGADGLMRVWDLRKFENLHTYNVRGVAEPLVFSQRRLLAAGIGTKAEIFRDPCTSPIVEPYLVHNCYEMITGLQFCPFEDVLGVGHRTGFVSLLVPGAGEPNLDAYEANPYHSKKQRRETEVRRLLDKIQPEMITLDADLIGRVDYDALESKLDEKLKILYLKPSKIDIHVKNKAKGKSGTASKARRKQATKEQRQKEQLRRKREVRRELTDEGILAGQEASKKRTNDSVPESRSALDRFKAKA